MSESDDADVISAERAVVYTGREKDHMDYVESSLANDGLPKNDLKEILDFLNDEYDGGENQDDIKYVMTAGTVGNEFELVAYLVKRFDLTNIDYIFHQFFINSEEENNLESKGINHPDNEYQPPQSTISTHMMTPRLHHIGTVNDYYKKYAKRPANNNHIGLENSNVLHHSGQSYEASNNSDVQDNVEGIDEGFRHHSKHEGIITLKNNIIVEKNFISRY